MSSHLTEHEFAVILEEADLHGMATSSGLLPPPLVVTPPRVGTSVVGCIATYFLFIFKTPTTVS